MTTDVLKTQQEKESLNLDFFNNKIYKPGMGERNILCDDWNTYINSESTLTKKILLCFYEKQLTVNDILKILNDVSENTIKVTISRLAKSIKIKCININDKTKKYELYIKGERDLLELVGDFYRKSEYVQLYKEKQIQESKEDSSKYYIKKIYSFLEEEKRDEIRKVLNSDKDYIEISLLDLSIYDPDLTDSLIDNPQEIISIFEETLCLFLENYDYIKKIKVRFRDLPKSDNIEINERRTKHLNKLVQLTGLIKRKTRPQPRVKSIEYYCTNNSCMFLDNKITINQNTHKIQILKACPKCKSQVTECSREEIDTQLILLEEDVSTMDMSKTNADAIKCVLSSDLTSKDKDIINDIGTKVVIVGILKAEQKVAKGGGESVDKTYYIDVNNIINDSKLNDIILTKEDVEQIKKLGESGNGFEELKENFLPEIMGYPTIKESLLLQLFGGNSFNGSRSESHILLLGDPGVAKSQMTKLQATYAKKSMYSSGSGSSKAGLTGAVIKDEMTGDYVLEAGAMSKASGGIMAIDEMDKMSDDDTGVMHEALEHGEITINKANINATVSCKCSVLASANPKFGKFQDGVSVSQQIDFPPALLSRFDLIFILKDRSDKKKDNLIANHILSNFTEENKESKFEIDFYKKYIHYCKTNFKPTMKKETAEFLSKEYVERRSLFENGKSKIPLGARQLNGWIRFSFALAKANFSNNVKLEHAQRAIEIFELCWENLGEENINDIENSNMKKTPIDGLLYKKVLEFVISNKKIQIKDIEKMFDKDTQKLKKIIKMLKSEGKVFETRKGILQIAEGFN